MGLLEPGGESGRCAEMESYSDEHWQGAYACRPDSSHDLLCPSGMVGNGAVLRGLFGAGMMLRELLSELRRHVRWYGLFGVIVLVVSLEWYRRCEDDRSLAA